MIAAQSQVATLVECFVIAAVIVSPFGYLRVRAVRRERARIAALNAPPPAEPEPEPTTARDLRDAVAGVAADAATREPGEVFVVTLPEGATIGGRTADAVIVETIVADGLRRDGIEIVDRTGPTWRCRRPEAAAEQDSGRSS